MKLFLLLHHEKSYAFQELEWARAKLGNVATTELDPEADDLSVKITKEALSKADQFFILMKEEVPTSFLFRLIDPNVIQQTNLSIFTGASMDGQHPVLKQLGERVVSGGDWKAFALEFFSQ